MNRNKKQSMFRTYKQFMEAGLNNDESAALHKIADEKVFGFGTAVDEKIFGIKEIKKLLKNQKKQSKGLDIKWKSKPVSRYITTDENSAVFADDLHLSIRAGKETVKMYMRISMVLNYSNGQWKVIHWHGSKPEQVESEKDTWGVENWKQKATELVRLVDEKTADLIGKNRELEIETALERTRTRSLLMQHSDELLDISKVFHEQLLLLGIDSAFSFVWLPNEEKGDHLFWATWLEEKGSNKQFQTRAITYPLDMTEPYTAACFVDWKSGVFVHEHFVAPENIDTFFASWAELLEGAERLKPAFFPDGIYYTEAFMKYGCFGIDIRRPLSPKEKEILHRFAIEFERSYTRFLDLQKAEAQAREAQIEAALERVRARAMAMHSSQELEQVAHELRTQMGLLGASDQLETCAINLYEESEENVLAWGATRLPDSSNEILDYSFYVPKAGITLIERMLQAYIAKREEYLLRLDGPAMIQWLNVLQQVKPDLFSMVDQAIDFTSTGQHSAWFSCAFFKGGALIMITFSEPDNQSRILLRRFALVFGLAYQRYADLKQAEAQAREAQIEAALERIRSRSLAMHHSTELREVISVTFEKLNELKVLLGTVAIQLFDMATKNSVAWVGTTLQDPQMVNLPYDEQMMVDDNFLYDSWKAMAEHTVLINKEYSFEQKNKYFNHLFLNNDFTQIPQEARNFLREMQRHIICFFPEKNSAFFVDSFNGESYPLESIKVIKRAAKVFEQAYIRFLDLQKAEAQAREAQIEAALERVRAKAMAMHSSQDLADTIGVFYKELQSFSITPRRCGVGLLKKENKVGEIFTWNTTEKGESLELVGKLQMTGHPILEQVYEHWLTQTDYYPVLKGGDEIKKYYRVLRPQMNFPDYDSDVIQYGYFFMFNEGGVYAWTDHEMNEAELQIYRRFKSVLSLTYKRYYDLQMAEAQAREATIETALEKVRGKAMAMHSSSDLSATASVVFTELRKLGVNPVRCGVGLLSKENRKAQLYATTVSEKGDEMSLLGWALLEGNPVLAAQYDKWLLQVDYYPVLKGEALKEYSQSISTNFRLPDISSDYTQYGCFLPFSEGFLYAWSEQPFGDADKRIMQRFKAIIDLTFRRYLELQQSEANALEAVRRASLDRVRAEIASMRTTEDLQRITPLVWNELTILGIPFIRCGVFIMDDPRQLIHTFLSTPDGKAIGSFHLPYDTPGKIAQVLQHWRDKNGYFDHWDKNAFVEFANVLVDQGALTSPDQYLSSIPDSGFHLHFLPFLQGMLYVGNTNLLGEQDIRLIQSIAEAFATAYARYEDFNKLEVAKKQVDETLNELQATQKQLIQSEKMASLGELTAGIAHEIQNPLNFVNNFSEVSKELLAEMKEAIEKGDTEDAKDIMKDVIQNLEKINHHGKRADGIVKGMLQHSRSGTGQKELTDINALCDEYLRLAFHGLRAKDKSFNAKFETSLDETVGKINVMPQDIGRVVLNLINNAFYAVSERKRNGETNYEPIVIVTTRKEGEKVLISVKDNGNGIPASIKEKIFQPFFTTKPTGQGTGLGLSLSYDIVKAHGGELKVVTKEGEGSEFIIQLRTN